MRCKACEYPLWDMAARRCPECGREFSPLEYTFTPNSVKFCCPHCRQQYYGTTYEGHLDPRAFACVKCGKDVDESQMIVLPADGMNAEDIQGGVVPWRERGTGRYGFFGAWFRTVWRSLFMPTQLARAAGHEVRMASAWGFFFLTTSVFWLAASVLFIVIIVAESGRYGQQLGFLDIMRTIMYSLLAIGAGPAALAVVTLIWAGTTHLLIMSKARSPFAVTLESFLYASPGLVLMSVPCLGIYMLWPFAACWMAISAILQIWVRQGVSGGRATMSVLALPAAVIVALTIIIAALIYFN